VEDFVQSESTFRQFDHSFIGLVKFAVLHGRENSQLSVGNVHRSIGLEKSPSRTARIEQNLPFCTLLVPSTWRIRPFHSVQTHSPLPQVHRFDVDHDFTRPTELAVHAAMPETPPPDLSATIRSLSPQGC
jgi:hypothetical protein